MMRGHREGVRQMAQFLQVEKVALTQRHIGRYLAQVALLRDPTMREVCHEVEE